MVPTNVKVTRKSLEEYINVQIKKLSSVDSNISESDRVRAISTYNSTLEYFKDVKLTKTELERHANIEIDTLMDEQKAERMSKRLGKSTRASYFSLRDIYYNVLEYFGLERVRNLS